MARTESDDESSRPAHEGESVSEPLENAHWYDLLVTSLAEILGCEPNASAVVEAAKVLKGNPRTINELSIKDNLIVHPAASVDDEKQVDEMLAKSKSFANYVNALKCFLTIFLLSGIWCHAAQVVPGVQMAAPVQRQTMFAPALTVIAPPTNKTNLFYNIGLTWDSVDSVLVTGYRINYGTNSAALTNTITATNTFCTVSNLAFKPTWYFQAFTLWGTNTSEGSYIVPVQPPIEAGFVLSTVFPLYASSDLVTWVTNKIVTLVLTNPPLSQFFRSHLKQLDYQWTNNQIQLKPFSIP